MDNGGSSSSASHASAPAPTQSRHHNHAFSVDDDDTDDLDFLNAKTGNGDDILGDDPLRDDLAEPLSFKRKQKQGILSQPARLFLSAFSGGNSSQHNPASPAFQSTGAQGLHSAAPPTRLDNLGVPHSKDGFPLDWYAEGPGRRVGYEDLTAIDWIFEYTKERQRLRVLASSASGLLGYVQQFLDASQVWVVLVLTGLAVGTLAAGIDVATDWLGDIKYGYCSNEDHGAFYLSKTSCCLGYEEQAKCFGWKPWSTALGISSNGGKWFIEYFVYLVLAVRRSRSLVWVVRCRTTDGEQITFAVSAAALVKSYAIYAKHSGIPEIKTLLGGFIIRRFLGLWTLITKSLGLVLAVASGMWLGKEGPLVHVACCCANLFTKLFPNINNNEGM